MTQFKLNLAGFLIVGIFFATLSNSSTVAAGSSPPDLSKQPTLYEIGYAHLDTQWRWAYPQTIREYLPNTLWDNFRLLERYPDYIFNFTGANRYRMMKEYWPDGYGRMKKWIAKGRWYPAGSAWEESDTLVPSSESLIRQILFGQRFFEREFGIESSEYMLPDCFGFPASLPSILSHCGLRGFSTQKLTWGSAVGIPFNVGIWEGPDGQGIIAALNAGAYDADVKENLSISTNWLARLQTNAIRSGLAADFHFYGTGDVGGAPEEESVRWIETAIASTGAVRVISARADQFFSAITDEQRSRLPKYKGDLLLTEHSAGSLTSQAYMKRWNRMNETLAEAAEKAAVAAHVLGAAPYPREKINRAWQLVLGAQFHDILPGTCIPRAYEHSWNDEIIALNSFAAVLENSVGGVARGLDTRGDGIPLVVFNPLSIEREDVVQAELDFSPKTGIQVFDGTGTPVPTQVLPGDAGQGVTNCRILFLAKVPSIGFAVFHVKEIAARDASAELKVSERSLENSRYRVTVNDAGDIANVFDKSANREILASPARLAFLSETPMHYPAWNMDWNDRKNPPRGYVSGPAQIRIVEAGPVRVALEVERKSEGSTFVQTIRLSTGSVNDRVEIANRIDWQSKDCSLKAEFPLAVSNPQATYNWGLGKIQRGNNDPKKYEVPTHQWFDLTDTNGAYGVTVLTDAKYGSDKPTDNTVRLTLLYSPGVRDSYLEQQSQDWGRHEFVYGLAGHKKDWRAAKSDWQGARLNQPLLAFRTAAHSGQLGRQFSLLRTSSDGIAVRTVKLAEDNDKVIVRLQELTGTSTENVSIESGYKVTDIAEVNGIERSPKSIKSSKQGLALDFNPYQLRSLAYRMRAPFKLSLAVSKPVALDYDLDVFSFPNLKQDGAGDGGRYTMPAEMIADTLVSEGVKFQIGPRELGKDNALSCRGQTVALPQGDFDSLYLLAFAVYGDTEAVFSVDGNPTTLQIRDWSSFIGSWDNRVFQGSSDKTKPVKNPVDRIVPGFIKRDPVAWFCSHRHQRDGSDQPYLYTYIFKYKIELPAGSKTLTLPDNPKLRIVAITAARNENGATIPAHPLYDDFTGRETVTVAVNQ